MPCDVLQWGLGAGAAAVYLFGVQWGYFRSVAVFRWFVGCYGIVGAVAVVCGGVSLLGCCGFVVGDFWQGYIYWGE